ncbi:hypothetical protein DB345_08145 [Spartobacteria bacterium LR76]|nr:hypothetical protein DB345_08145 [Spartobacteria bacterium LR76]
MNPKFSPRDPSMHATFSHGEICNVQILRGLAAIFVIFYHIYLWEGKNFGRGWASPNFFRIGDAGVDIFFTISGFIMVYIQPKALSDWTNYRRFILNRITRIFPPYWIVSLALLPLWILRPDLFNNFYHNQVDIVRSFLLLPQNYTPLHGVGWTLIHELYFYFVVSFALLFGFRTRILFGLIWGGIILLVNFWLGDNAGRSSPFLQLCLSPFSLTFLLGYFVGLFSTLPLQFPNKVHYTILLAGVLLLIYAFYFPPPGGVYPNNNSLRRFIMYGLPGAAFLFAFIGLEKSWRGHFRIFEKIGNASYSIYLTHLPLIAAIYALFSKTLPPALSSHPPVLIGIGILSLCVSILAGVIFHLWIELPSVKLARSLCGVTNRKMPAT